MGRKDKHKLGQSRNSAVFKVVGGKAGKANNKGKPKGVELKLKKVIHLIYQDRSIDINIFVSRSARARLAWWTPTL